MTDKISSKLLNGRHSDVEYLVVDELEADGQPLTAEALVHRVRHANSTMEIDDIRAGINLLLTEHFLRLSQDRKLTISRWRLGQASL